MNDINIKYNVNRTIYLVFTFYKLFASGNFFYSLINDGVVWDDAYPDQLINFLIQTVQ